MPLIYLAFFPIAILTVFIQAEVFGAETMTLRLAVQTAVTKNPTVQVAREKISELDQSASLAGSQIFPTISIESSANHKKDPVNGPLSLFSGEPYNFYSIAFQAKQPIFPGMWPWAGLKPAKLNREIAQIDSEIAERDLTLSVIQNFYGILFNQRKVETLLRAQQVNEELLKATEQKHRIGRTQLLDVLQARAQLALLAPKILQAKNSVKVSATQLAGLMGAHDSNEVNVSGAFDSIDFESLNSQIKKSQSRILEVEKADRQLAQQQASRPIVMAKNYPQLNAIGSWGRSGYIKSDLLSDYGTGWALAIQLSIPLFSGLSSFHERGLLNSQTAQLQMSRENTWDQASLNQVQSKKDYELSQEIVQSSKRAFDIGQMALKQAQRDYRLSTINYIQYFSTQQSLLDSELAYEQAKYDFIVNLAKYFTAWGYPLTELVALLDAKSERK